MGPRAIPDRGELATLTDKILISFHEKFKEYDLGEGHPFEVIASQMR
jgi:hypothetical protein